MTEEIAQAHAKIHIALLNNFDTPLVLQILKDLMTSANKYVADPAQDNPNVLVMNKACMIVTKFLRIFGVVEGMDELGFQASGSGEGGSVDVVIKPYMDKFTEFRDAVREVATESKSVDILKLCDKVRDDDLPEVGIRLLDSSEKGVKASWDLVGVEELKREN